MSGIDPEIAALRMRKHWDTCEIARAIRRDEAWVYNLFAKMRRVAHFTESGRVVERIEVTS